MNVRSRTVLKVSFLLSLLLAGCAQRTPRLAIDSESALRGQTREVVVLVGSLDCESCNYGLKQRLLGLAGMRDVSIDRDAGEVVICLDASSALSLDDLAQEIRNGGFDVDAVFFADASVESDAPVVADRAPARD
jgi:hypothetical protein